MGLELNFQFKSAFMKRQKAKYKEGDKKSTEKLKTARTIAQKAQLPLKQPRQRTHEAMTTTACQSSTIQERE
jgi:hypothetical protein